MDKIVSSQQLVWGFFKLRKRGLCWEVLFRQLWSTESVGLGQVPAQKEVTYIHKNHRLELRPGNKGDWEATWRKRWERGNPQLLRKELCCERITCGDLFEINTVGSEMTASSFPHLKTYIELALLTSAHGLSRVFFKNTEGYWACLRLDMRKKMEPTWEEMYICCIQLAHANCGKNEKMWKKWENVGESKERKKPWRSIPTPR